MDPNFLTWLETHLPNLKTRQTSISDVRRIEAQLTRYRYSFSFEPVA